ncbi:stromal membrane-associated protein 1-like isoform X1 [Tachypleus tridentatus]|uniref:stromal membrane-associated protein 1-like isoform X1 n=1 Tax=Tachypleus tridentatus TaxID=6853 RepID=UPI003FD5FCA6
MANKTEKQMQDKCQTILCQLLREEDNKYCVDCDAKGPRWASWNLGIFLCIRCAGIHRNLGVHISKVKSVNLDTWTPEQVGVLQAMGNSKARAVYEANLPDNFRRPQTDSSLEAFVRAKYEHKRYIAKEWVPPAIPKPAFDVREDKKKEKKKSKVKGSGTIEIPICHQPAAVPRPHPTTNATTSESQQSSSSGQSELAPVDLLGLMADASGTSSAEDLFDSILTTTSTVACISSSVATVSNPEKSSQCTEMDEKDFFNQPMPAESQEKKILTKETILSLYSSGTKVSQPSFAVPGGVYLPQTAPVIGGIPSSGVMSVANGMMGSQLQTNGISQGTQAGPSTNPFGSLGVGSQGVAAWDSGLSNCDQGTPGLFQIQNQMASLQMGGQSWGSYG